MFASNSVDHRIINFRIIRKVERNKQSNIQIRLTYAMILDKFSSMKLSVKSIFLVAALALSIGSAAPAYAVDEISIGPKVGASLPHSLKVKDQNSQYRDFKALARKRGLIVMFSRSLDW
ncbi:MAG: hypothetical protein CMM52_08445 [Rhodospirillaceae bacterium]|nr:hypothetical protein [Rhodospirillaceae bacterium]|tara:strand:+ start:44158 stop:44514 length:357 start_codon:yes stop_codon:yes gene_type:complete